MLAITAKPVIIIGMRIEKEFEENENAPSAVEAMEASMEMIMRFAIEPAMENDLVDEEGQKVLGLVAGVLKTIASKAEAYEQVFENGGLNENSRN